MDVILLDKVQNLGALGDQVKVRSGYARNFLIPRGKAAMATAENRAHFEERRKELEEKLAVTIADAQTRADKLSGTGIELARRAGEEGKLFGSVGTADIAQALSDSTGVTVEKQDVSLPDGLIRQVGEYSVDLHLHADVSTSVTVNVVPE